MSHREIDSEHEVRENAVLARVVEELREPVPVRTEWRAGMLRGIGMLPPPNAASESPFIRRWSIGPLTAVAAGLLCALAGAALTMALLGRMGARGSGDVLDNLTATMPLPGETNATQSTVHFVFVAPYASRVSLVGDFNGWNPRSLPMRRSRDGHAWLLDVPLAPGRHVYSFVVDGDLAPDPAAPRAGDDDFGVPSSVVLVAGPKA